MDVKISNMAEPGQSEQGDMGKGQSEVGRLGERIRREAEKEGMATQEYLNVLQYSQLVDTASAVRRLVRVQEGSARSLLIPEYERPTDRLGWINLVRVEVKRLRELGESPYSPYLWGERPETRRILDSIPEIEEFSGLRDSLATEVWVVQREDKLYSQFRQHASSLEGLSQLIDTAPKAGNMLTPSFLLALSSLPETSSPKWLENVIPEREKSMSVQVSRAIYIYVKFFGQWSEAIANKLDRPGGIEDQGRTKWLAGEFGKDTKKWLAWVTSELDKTDWPSDTGMQTLNRGVLEKLSFGNSGTISAMVLKEMFRDMPPDLKADRVYKEVKSKVDVMSDSGGMSLFDLLKIDKEGRRSTNMFCQNVDKSQTDYTRWLVGALSGNDYAEESAKRFLNFTGESGQMNTTATPAPYQSDSFYQLAWEDRRRMSEKRRRRAVGPITTLGRYKKPLCESWLRGAELEITREKKNILTLLREGNWFHTLPWSQLNDETYVGDFLLRMSHTTKAFSLITDGDIPLNASKDGLLSGVDTIPTINKKFQFAFPNWEEEKDGKTGFERREEWAKQAIELVRQGRLKELNSQEWSPWTVFLYGLIYEHQPDQKLPLDGLQSPTGVKKEGKIPHGSRWNKEEQIVDRGQLYSANSISDLLRECVEADFLTPSEKELLYSICQLK